MRLRFFSRKKTIVPEADYWPPSLPSQHRWGGDPREVEAIVREKLGHFCIADSPGARCYGPILGIYRDYGYFNYQRVSDVDYLKLAVGVPLGRSVTLTIYEADAHYWTSIEEHYLRSAEYYKNATEYDWVAAGVVDRELGYAALLRQCAESWASQ